MSQPPDQKRRTITHDATHEGGRRRPQTPVFPQFDAPDTPQPAPRERSRRRGCVASGCALPALALGGIALALVAVALFLPPISLWDEIDQRLNENGSATPTALPEQTVIGGLIFRPLNPPLETDGLTIEAASGAPDTSFGISVVALAPADFLAGNLPDDGWHCGADFPANHALISPIYSLTQTGPPPERFALQVAAPPDSETRNAELLIWNADANAWEFFPAQPAPGESVALRAESSFLPRCVAMFREPESVRRAGVTLALDDTFDPGIMAANVRLYPGSLSPTVTGALQVVLAPGFQTGQGYEVHPLIQNFDDPAVIDAATVERILDNGALRTEHARQIAAFALGYDGIALDYREIPTDLGDAYTAFLRDLADLLHSQDRTLTVVLPTPVLNGDTWDTGAYDWPAIGRIADDMVITIPLDPGAYAPGGTADALLAWATTQITRGNLVLGLNALSVEDGGDGTFASITLRDALAYMGEIQLDPGGTVEPGQTITARLANPAGIKAEFGSDDAGLTIRYSDPDGTPLRAMRLTDFLVFYQRMARAEIYGLGGVFVWNLMSPGVAPGVENALLAYRLDQGLGDESTQLAVEWIARDGDTVIAQESAQPGESFEFQADAGAGALITVEARVLGELISRATIRVLAPEATVTPTPTDTPEPTVTPTVEPTAEPTATSTPTNTPEATATPTPTETPTPPGMEIVPLPTLPGDAQSAVVNTLTPTFAPEATVTPAPTETIQAASTATVEPTATIAALPTAIPTNTPAGPPPLDLSQPPPAVDPALLATAEVGMVFEVGAHLGGVTPAIVEVGRMGLTWIKVEIKYLYGQSPEPTLQVIDDAQANGFKILLNVTGDPFEFAGMDRATYLAGYVDYVGQLAARGADGIEVWREMNGRMTPEEYVQLLAWSAYAIKTAHPNTLVITGALGPTPAANLDEDDGAYYARLGELNVAQYADCIGVQHIIGTVPPASVGGDPRGDSPVYYFPTMTDRALRASGGLVPVCYTRLGYLSPEGYPPLPEEYAWAQTLTAAQQAQWLADAIRLSMEGTQVRLLIIWSLDAAFFGGGSPEQGYALVRPDGACPACELIAPLFEDRDQ